MISTAGLKDSMMGNPSAARKPQFLAVAAWQQHCSNINLTPRFVEPVSHPGVTPETGHVLKHAMLAFVSHFGCDPMVGHGLGN
jgi:hypothetical protein